MGVKILNETINQSKRFELISNSPGKTQRVDNIKRFVKEIKGKLIIYSYETKEN